MDAILELNIVTDKQSSFTGSFSHPLLDSDIPMPDNLVDVTGWADKKRYSVYRNNVVVSLMEALGDAYPAIKNLLGKDFPRIARNYVASHPPHSPMMHEYGEEFIAFVDKFPPLKDLPFLKDVARAERAWQEAFHGPDEPILEAGTLAAIEPDLLNGICFKPKATTALVESAYAIGNLFTYRSDTPDEIEDLNEAQTLLITRPQFYVEARQLLPEAAVFFRHLLAGDTLAIATTQTLEKDADSDIAALISLALQSGAFTQVLLPGETPTLKN